MSEIAVYVLVFLAVSMFLFELWRSFAAIGREHGESLDDVRRKPGEYLPPMDRFIAPGALFLKRILAALVPAILVPGAFLLVGFTNPLVLVGIAVFLAWAGWMLPYWYYAKKVEQRKLVFESKILDLTMGLANALKAGMALPQGLERVSSQMGGVMEEELSVVLSEYRLGVGIVDSLWRLQERMPCEDLRLIASAVKVTMQSGGSLVEVLSKMVDMIRSRTEFQEKLKTLTAQGRFEALAMASAPLAAFILLYFCQPDLMKPLVTTTTGWLAIGVAAALEVIGFLVIQKIVTIEV